MVDEKIVEQALKIRRGELTLDKVKEEDRPKVRQTMQRDGVLTQHILQNRERDTAAHRSPRSHFRRAIS